ETAVDQAEHEEQVLASSGWVVLGEPEHTHSLSALLARRISGRLVFTCSPVLQIAVRTTMAAPFSAASSCGSIAKRRGRCRRCLARRLAVGPDTLPDSVQRGQSGGLPP